MKIRRVWNDLSGGSGTKLHSRASDRDVAGRRYRRLKHSMNEVSDL